MLTMRSKRVLFIACLTSGTIAGAAMTELEIVLGMDQSVFDIPWHGLRGLVLVGAGVGQFLSVPVSLGLMCVGDGRGRPLHPLAAAAWTAFATGLPIGIVMGFVLPSC
jgi:hypothetical protein